MQAFKPHHVSSRSPPHRHAGIPAAVVATKQPQVQQQQQQQRNVLQPLQPGEVWYFAFGSNMSPAVLTGRRAVKPRQSLPCRVPDHVLSFNVQGFPYSEPGFATIERTSSTNSDAPIVHGVLHRITKREWSYIKATEGVGSAAVGYQVVPVTCELYDGVTLTAVTLQSAPASLHKGSRGARPSARYLRLLQKGAAHHGVDAEYQAYLSSLQPYQARSSLQRTLGGAVSGAVLLAAAAPAVPVYVASRALGRALPPGSDEREDSAASGSILPFLSWYVNKAQAFTWRVHDAAIAPLLGSGCRSDD